MSLRRRARANRQPGHATGTQPTVVVQTGGSGREERRSRVTTEEIDSFTMRLIGRYGSAEAALQHIAGEQLKYRRRAQEAEADAEELRSQLPTAEAVVLTGDEAKEYKAIKTGDAKFTLVGLSQQLKELGDLRSNVAKGTRATELETAAGKKYKKSLLSRLLGDMPLTFKPKLVPKADDPNETEEVQVPFVKVGDTLMSMDAWLEQEHGDLLDALKVADEEGTSTTQQSTESRQTSKSTVTMPKQTPTGTQSGAKGKDKDLLAVIDKQLSVHKSPGQLRKEAAGK